MTRNVKKEMKDFSSKCYFPEKRTLGLVASILAVENVVAPEGEIQKTAKLGRATSGPWRYRGCSINTKDGESHNEQPVVHGDTDSVVASELVVTAPSEQDRLAVARVASTERTVNEQKQSRFKNLKITMS